MDKKYTLDRELLGELHGEIPKRSPVSKSEYCVLSITGYQHRCLRRWPEGQVPHSLHGNNDQHSVVIGPDHQPGEGRGSSN